MDASKINTWLSLGANLGVVVGLILLVFEIDQNTEMMQMSNRFEAANHHDVHMDRVRERMLVVAQSEDMTRIWRMGSEGEELDADELARWEVMASHRILIQRDAWVRGRILGNMPGLVNPTVYLDILVTMLEQNPKFRHFYETSPMRGVGWTQEFLDYVDSRLIDTTSVDGVQ